MRNIFAAKRSNSGLVGTVTENSTSQVLRSVQNATNCTRIHGCTSRGLKLSNLPSLSKLKDAQLRQSLFTELRHCGHIQSVVLPPVSTDASSASNRVAIVTFRLPEEAECAYHALQSGEKLLFSAQICAELHPGFESEYLINVLGSKGFFVGAYYFTFSSFVYRGGFFPSPTAKLPDVSFLINVIGLKVYRHSSWFL